MSTALDDEVDSTIASSKPPFLRRVRIRNYKSIAFCDVALEPLTILVGRNASGKSNFLDALAFLRDTIESGLGKAIDLHGGSLRIAPRFESDKCVSFDLEMAIEAGNRVAVYRLDVQILEEQPARIVYESLHITESKNEGAIGFERADNEVRFSNSNGRNFNPGLLLGVQPVLRSFHETPPELTLQLSTMQLYNFDPNKMRELQIPKPGYYLDRNGANLASVIETTGKSNVWTKIRIGQYLSAITGCVELVDAVKIGSYETVRFRVARNDRPLEFDAFSMSDGTLRALAALVAAFQMNSVGYPSLVGIEEPDTALHPRAMRALVDALDEATLRTQILLTTHSAEMLDNPTIGPENVRVVQIINGQTVIAPVDKASVEIIREQFNTLGGLERDNQLEPDQDDLERQEKLILDLQVSKV